MQNKPTYIRMQSAHFWNDFDKQVGSFTVNQSTDNNNNNFRSARTLLRLTHWLKHGSVNSIRYYKNLLRRQTRSQNRVLLTCMRNTYSLTHICQGKLQNLVHVNASSITKTIQGMIGKHNLVSHDSSMHKGLMTKCWKSLMSMHNGNSFSSENSSYNWECSIQSWKCVLIKEWSPWNIVDF